jgi:hypothetical protein
MAYKIIAPPFTLRFREMSRRELREYRQWFPRVIPSRIEELASAVTGSAAFEAWQPDETLTSLDLLGDWFAKMVGMRPRTQKELQEIASRLPYAIEVPEEDLTNESFSFAMDIGMYFARVLLRAHPSLRWEQPLDDKRFADYGQPVLVGFGPVPLNPIRIAVTLAYGLAGGTQRGKRLRELYDYWSARAQT